MTYLYPSQVVASGSSSSVFGALGIDWKLLVFQIIAFLILVWLLGKFVFPPLMKVVDDRQKRVDESNAAAAETAKQAAETEAKLTQLLKQARTEAADIVATAKEEANDLFVSSEKKSKLQAERIAMAAHDSIEKEVLSAKKALHNETIELVAEATKKVIGKTVTPSVDKQLINQSIHEVSE